MVEDVDVTVAFYCDVLGFELVAATPDNGPLEWAMVRRGEVELVFQSRRALAAEFPQLAAHQPAGALTLYLPLDGSADALYDRVAPHAEVLREVETTFYGKREFTLRDPNGVFLTFAADPPPLSKAA